MLSLASTEISSWDSQISDIEAQIAALQVEARNTRRHRNALVPINQLPNEILVLVFLQRRDSFIDSNSSRNWRWTRGCLDVCSHWRSLCLATPRLWTYVVVDTRVGAEMAMSLTRLPFHIIVRARRSSLFNPEWLGNFLHRAASLEFDGWLYELDDLMIPIQGNDESPVFSAPDLERIDITVEDEQNAVHRIIAPLLHGAPNLRYISFAHNDRNTFGEDIEDPNGYYHPLSSLASLFPHLVYLHLFGDYVAGAVSSDDSLSLFPHLRTLVLERATKNSLTRFLPAMRLAIPVSLRIEHPTISKQEELEEVAKGAAALLASRGPVQYRALQLTAYKPYASIRGIYIKIRLSADTGDEFALSLAISDEEDLKLFQLVLPRIVKAFGPETIQEVIFTRLDLPIIDEDIWTIFMTMSIKALISEGIMKTNYRENETSIRLRC